MIVNGTEINLLESSGGIIDGDVYWDYMYSTQYCPVTLWRSSTHITMSGSMGIHLFASGGQTFNPYFGNPASIIGDFRTVYPHIYIPICTIRD